MMVTWTNRKMPREIEGKADTWAAAASGSAIIVIIVGGWQSHPQGPSSPAGTLRRENPRACPQRGGRSSNTGARITNETLGTYTDIQAGVDMNNGGRLVASGSGACTQ